MKVFHCESCGNLLFFENSTCVTCGHTVAFLPDTREVRSLEPKADGVWASVTAGDPGRYRLCRNYIETKVCNWAVLADEGQEYCSS